jgi:DhnA family fructose-bisphosphate aldolase class Ia
MRDKTLSVSLTTSVTTVFVLKATARQQSRPIKNTAMNIVMTTSQNEARKKKKRKKIAWSWESVVSVIPVALVVFVVVAS